MQKRLLLTAIICSSLIFSCKKSEDKTEESDSLQSLATEALSEVSAQSSANEGGLTAVASQASTKVHLGAIDQIQTLDILESELATLKSLEKSASYSSEIKSYVSPTDRVFQAASACRYSARTCSSGTGTITWDGCSISGPNTTITMSGGWTEVWSDTGSCITGYLASNTTVDRSTDSSVVNFPAGATVTTDTQGGKAYDGTEFVSGAITTHRTTTTNRSIFMNPSNSAIHKVFRGRRGTVLFDYYTQPNINVTGARQNSTNNGMGTTRIMNGIVTIHHNLAQYTASNAFTNVTWSDSSCCFPTSGTVTSTFSGTNPPTGPATVTFLSTCGQAKLTTPDNPAGTTFTLDNCQ